MSAVNGTRVGQLQWLASNIRRTLGDRMIPRTKLELDLIADCCLDGIRDECILNATDDDGYNPARSTLKGWTSSNFLPVS
jgi:hypothetical protein